MTSLEAYKSLLLKINKNDTNRNVRIGKGTFVMIFNEQAEIEIVNSIENDSDSSEKNGIAELLIHDLKIEKEKVHDNFISFKLPSNFLEYEASYSIASKGKCKDRILYNWDFKTKNKNSLLQDENNNPSFEYEQTLINISGDNLIVFKSDFDIDSQYLTYYKRPLLIDLEGYTKINGTQSANIDPDISNYLVNKIVNRCAVEIVRDYGNSEDFPIAKDRLNDKQ